MPGISSGNSGGFGFELGNPIPISPLGLEATFFGGGFSSMNLFSPFSPPGNPPVRPRSSFSKASSPALIDTGLDGEEVASFSCSEVEFGASPS